MKYGRWPPTFVKIETDEGEGRGCAGGAQSGGGVPKAATPHFVKTIIAFVSVHTSKSIHY